MTTNEKTYLQRRTEYLLQESINAEIQRIKNLRDMEPDASIEKYCTEIGILVALKNQAKDLINNL